jgi:hypothetical protein
MFAYNNGTTLRYAVRITEQFQGIFWELRNNAALPTENNGTVPLGVLRIATRFTKNVDTALRWFLGMKYLSEV